MSVRDNCFLPGVNEDYSRDCADYESTGNCSFYIVCI